MRDSAGVRIVENVAPPHASGWRIDPEPLVSLGGRNAEGPEAFSRVLGAIRDAQGRIVVLDQAARELRFFAADGSFLHASGRAGGGPGEFGALSPAYIFTAPLYQPQALIPWRGDSLLVHQFIPPALHVLDADGAYGRKLELRGGLVYGYPGDSAVLLSGSSGSAVGPPVDGWDQVLLLRADANGVVEEIGHLPLRPAGEAVRFEPVGIWTPRPGGFISARTDRPEFRFHDARGMLSRIVRVPLSASTVSDTAGPMPEVAPVADILPLFRTAVLDRTGHLWIAPYQEDLRAPADRLYVVDPDGIFLGHVDLPDGLRPVDAGEDWMLGIWMDELDVEHVKLYRLHRGTSGK